MKKILLFILFASFSLFCFSQHKADVVVNGASAVGTSAAIQAARSGVKVILLSYNDDLIYHKNVDFNFPAFEKGLWQEWNDKIKSDTLKKDSTQILEQILLKEKNIKIIRNITLQKIEYKKKSWKLSYLDENEKAEISTKVLVDAKENTATFKSLFKEKKEFLPSQNSNNINNDLFTSVGAGILQDSSVAHISFKNLLYNSEINYINYTSDFNKLNLAHKMNIGQAIGAMSAYAPFFDVKLAEGNIRMIQAEILNYSGIIIPVKDVSVKDSAFKDIQQIIASGLISFDKKYGLFYPNDLVNFNSSIEVIKNLYPRSKIWFIENSNINKQINLDQLISLISFIGGREENDLKREINQMKEFNLSHLSSANQRNLSRRDFSIICNKYLKPFKINVDSNGSYKL